MIFPKWLRAYGDKSYRGQCNSEQTDQIDFMSWLAFHYPQYRLLAVHPKGEGKRSWGQIDIAKKTGEINPGASDIIIPDRLTFVMELKRKDHTKSAWKQGQQEYLFAGHDAGCFACVALGVEGAKLAFLSWLAEKEALSCTASTT
jgi:hypothetical protein